MNRKNTASPVLEAILLELQAQEIDPMPLVRKAACIYRAILIAQETGKCTWTLEELMAQQSDSQAHEWAIAEAKKLELIKPPATGSK